MTRIVDRRNSQAAEDKDPKAVRPDRVGKRGLDPRIVEDRPDPAALRGKRMDDYLKTFVPTEGKSK